MNPQPQPQKTCATCGRPFPELANNPRKRYCTPRCRVADWHSRNDRPNRQPAASLNAGGETGNAVPNAVPNGVPTSNGVPNAVPNAVTRCPHCAQPVAVITLLLAPAAAHIATPAAADA